MARGAVVVICSDGWDRGDPAVIGAEMARLSRVARRVVWVNPLKASPGYAPLARGMAAALPYVDQFVEGHAVASLERLAEIIAGTATKGASAVKEVLTDIERWRGQGKRVALARVVGVEGSGPRLPGRHHGRLRGRRGGRLGVGRLRRGRGGHRGARGARSGTGGRGCARSATPTTRPSRSG